MSDKQERDKREVRRMMVEYIFRTYGGSACVRHKWRAGAAPALTTVHQTIHNLDVFLHPLQTDPGYMALQPVDVI